MRSYWLLSDKFYGAPEKNANKAKKLTHLANARSRMAMPGPGPVFFFCYCGYCYCYCWVAVLIAEMLSRCPGAAGRAHFAESANVPMVEKKCQNWDTTLRLKKEMINGNINTRISR